MYRLQCTNIQALVFDSGYSASGDLPLPVTASGSGLYDLIGFLYNSDTSKWMFIAKLFGF